MEVRDHFDSAAVGLNDPLSHGETETNSTAGAGGIHLVKTVENPWKMLIRNSNPRVFDFHDHFLR